QVPSGERSPRPPRPLIDPIRPGRAVVFGARSFMPGPPPPRERHHPALHNRETGRSWRKLGTAAPYHPAAPPPPHGRPPPPACPIARPPAPCPSTDRRTAAPPR